MAGYQEKTRGQIKVGFVADFTVLEENPFTIEKENLADIHVLKTIISEQIVFG